MAIVPHQQDHAGHAEQRCDRPAVEVLALPVEDLQVRPQDVVEAAGADGALAERRIHARPKQGRAGREIRQRREDGGRHEQHQPAGHDREVPGGARDLAGDDRHLYRRRAHRREPARGAMPGAPP